MRRAVRGAALGALALVVGLSVLLVTRHPVNDATSAPSPLLGRAAPALVGPELGGGRFDLAHLRGQVVVVSFWASWCGPCVREAPALSTFAWAMRHRGVRVVGVVFDDTVGAARAFSRHYGSLYPSLVDPNGEIANAYGVTSPPSTFVIDTRGRVAAELLGPVTTAQLDQVIARVRA